ncbi:MAG: hypothetical protein KF799_00250 [Bdellovibrionales bacterium]|nr:hypothetical protein [Bdellovibrionales bacterium]
MKLIKGFLIFLAVASVLASLPSMAQPSSASDKAVVEYLRLRNEGKLHREALSTVQDKYAITRDQLEEAANRISTAGYPTGVKPTSNQRAPGSTSKKK